MVADYTFFWEFICTGGVRKKSSFSNCELKARIVFYGSYDCRLQSVNFVICDQFWQPFDSSGSQIDSRRCSAEWVLDLILHENSPAPAIGNLLILFCVGY